jgi:murein DD-endopeptidase MepM/ murein hydrolase activator NlpD
MTFFHRLAAVLLPALLLAQAFPALALPTAASVPGGVALVALGAVSPGAAAPRVSFYEQRVLVGVQDGQWFAVVGLALDLATGSHELLVSDGTSERTVSFVVRAKNYPEQRITLKDSSKVTLSDEDGVRALAEIATIQTLKRHFRETDASRGESTDSDFQLPAKGRLASRFGLRRIFNGEPRAPHGGLDLAVARGTPIGASAAGRVLAVDDYFFNGKTVFVDHGNGLLSMYCHLDRIDVLSGEAVVRGQRLGRSGMTGRASGPHLHWSVIANGALVDPELFVKKPAPGTQVR